MVGEAGQKVTAAHLRRDAYLYVRQSTLRQVFENQESTKRQYALRERAVALGWSAEQIVVIDCDLGHSGASATDRPGFQRLVTDVGMGRVGIVLGLEVSRLARSSADWARLLEICALSDTLLLDEDGIYDPGSFNDRLLLGLKGTMSEAELHFLHARMRGGQLNKARRGELKLSLPIGFVYGPDGRVGFDPDQQVQEAIRCFFATFRRVGSATATVRAFREQGLRIPRRIRRGPHCGELHWVPLVHSRALQILHNPRYAGAFFYGRYRTRRGVDGRYHGQRLPRAQWTAFFPDAHPGYLSWAEYEDNLRRLRDNAQAQGVERRKSPPREGPALLQGLVICGRCGDRMTVRYETERGPHRPYYVCQRRAVEHASAPCQHVPGDMLDAAVGAMLVEAVSPLAIEVSLGVQQELDARTAEVERLRRQQVERARHAADLAQRRYMSVDPGNRLVAATLEADWNGALRALREAEEECERRREADRLELDAKQKEELLRLATDFPRLWRDPRTPDRDRKRLLRLMVEDVTLVRGAEITANVRFKGGAVRTITLPLPLPAWKRYRTPDRLVEEVDRLLGEHTAAEIAAMFNTQGYRTGRSHRFTATGVEQIVRQYQLTSRFARLRARGLLSPEELAAQLGICLRTLHQWHRRGLLKGHPYNAKNSCLFEAPGPDLPPKFKFKQKRRTIGRVTLAPGAAGAGH